jgi:hypothetical protein
MPWHRQGTISVAQNSNVVTGVNTAFAANTRIGDAFIGPDGRQYELGNVASDTVISIIPPYIGPTVSGAGYAITPIQGYQKGLADQVRSWVNSYGSKMAALGTTGNYDVLPLSKGGTGVAANTGAEVVAAIGALPVGAGGILGDARFFSGNIDSVAAVPKGRCFVSSATGGTKPTGFSFGLLDTVSAEGNQGAHQTFHVVDGVAGGGTLKTFQRDQYGSGGFGPWRMDYRQNSILGTVTSDMSGAGAIIEYGSNANGRYTKFAGGLMICESAPSTVAVGGGGITGGNISLPATFINSTFTPMISGAAATSNDHYGFTSLTPVNNSTVTWIFRNGATAQNISGVRVLAVGRWFL